jgi:hypothetical protein
LQIHEDDIERLRAVQRHCLKAVGRHRYSATMLFDHARSYALVDGIIFHKQDVEWH